MADFFLWYAILWLIGIAGLPLSFTFFSRLPDRGYSFTRPLSLLLVTLVAWWLGNLKLLPFDGLAGWLAIGLVGLGAWLLLLNRKVCRELFAWFSQRQNLKYVLAGELVFLAAYSFIVNARSFMVDQHPVTEKFFNLGFINAIATSTTLPPPDPWFGGQPINYYYGGHLIIAELCKLSGVGANIGYNLGIGLIFALTALACYGLVANLVGLAKSKPPAYNESALSEEPSPLLRPTLTKNSELETRNSSIWAGVLGAALVMFFGNLGVVRQWWIHGFQLLPFGNPDFPFKLDWYNTSRLIFDVMPRNGVETILTEYPISSALKGDLHAFDMSGPYIALVLGLVLHLLVEPARFALVRSRRSALPNLLMAGLLVGALSFINGVDFPNFLLLVILALGLAELRAGGR